MYLHVVRVINMHVFSHMMTMYSYNCQATRTIVKQTKERGICFMEKTPHLEIC